MSDKLIRPIIEGLLGFRLFESKCGMSGVYSEYFYYPAFYKIIFHRKDLRIINEFSYKKKLKIKKGEGRPEQIDFFVYNIEKTFKSAFEVKIKTGNKINCNNDIIKLRKFIKSENQLYAYLIVLSSMPKMKTIKEIKKENRDKHFKDLLLSKPKRDTLLSKPKKDTLLKYLKYHDHVQYTSTNKTYFVVAFKVLKNDK